MPELAYDLIADWEQVPSEYVHVDVAGVAVDASDRVYLLTRNDARVLVYEPDGSFVAAWGEGLFTNRAHGIAVAPDDTVYCVDDGAHSVQSFSPTGDLLMTLRTSGIPSETGYDGKDLRTVARGGPPFNRPTNVAVTSTGELYVTDGYGNARVHHFSAQGELLRSWGEPGTGPGQFHLPHGLAVAPDGEVLVADRENDRIQRFDPEGHYLGEWTDVYRPTHLAIANGLAYVSELWWKPGRVSYRLGAIAGDRPGRVSILDLGTGAVVARLGGTEQCQPGNFVAAHGIAVDSRGDLYVAEVAYSFAVSRGLAPAGCHSFQKFKRR